MDISDQLHLELKRLSEKLDPRAIPNQYAIFLNIQRIFELLLDTKITLEWIDVKDRMPDQPNDITQIDQYWCALECGLCELIKFAHTTSGHHEFIWNTHTASTITHWMKLPCAPSKVNK
jgi:hypothetical protein